ncbi:putative pectinesterase [Lupinus albus]|uniref:Pectinesterase n=1 Tax=Lupinus albus TaxID=3870 RepID=A0A6A4QAZ4_LUPAL|nr:putative pectinesterase [Lupinus albus]
MVLFRWLITLLIVPFLFSSTVSGYSLSDIKKWCSQTPNPKPCEYYLSDNAFNKPIKNKSDFLKVSLQVALDQAQKGQENTKSLGPKCRNSQERAAWADCLELYEYTIQRLNEILDPNTKFTQVDAQTWLSTALTNLETCKDGFYDLSVSDHVLPLLSNNVTKLISNALSLNKVSDQQQSYKDGFPTWVKPSDRKLLRSSYAFAKANVVVAKDGSGKYKTVKAAIDAAPQNSNDRYVIYVKQGTYDEQIVIKAKNIMLVGDGIGKTIISGSKSVQGGSTTFNSATVGKQIFILP